METVLVTGGAGFIGSNIAEACLAQGCRVVILDDLSTGKMENVFDLGGDANLKFVKGSILDSELLRSLIRTEHISLISHQAAVSSVSRSIADPVRTMETNVTGTANLFQIATECGCSRVVFASSAAVYGDAPELPKCEAMAPWPKSPYAVSKEANEILGTIFSGLYNIEVVGLRYFNVYGKRQDPASEHAAVVPKFIEKALKNEPLPVEGDGCQTRDFVYIDDVVRANLNALSGKDGSGVVYNVAKGERTSILELARIILDLTRSSSGIEFKPARAGDVRDSVGDTGLARLHLGFEPSFTIREGLSGTIAWYRGRSARELAA